MTGYGEASARGEDWTVTVTIKTLNHKYLDLHIKGLEDYEVLELQARQLVKGAFHRGRVEVVVRIEQDEEKPLTFDLVTARRYAEALKRLARQLELDGRVSLSDLIALGEALRPLPPEPEGLWPVLETALKEALAAVNESRRREGEALAEELKRLVREITAELSEVEAHAPQLKERYRERLREKILNMDIPLDEERLEQEVALWAERSDITEEIARMKIHLKAVEGAISSKEPAGRTLDFLAQEMYRETNTMAAKAKDGEIAQRLIAIKGCIERLREQVRNVE